MNSETHVRDGELAVAMGLGAAVAQARHRNADPAATARIVVWNRRQDRDRPGDWRGVLIGAADNASSSTPTTNDPDIVDPRRGPARFVDVTTARRHHRLPRLDDDGATSTTQSPSTTVPSVRPSRDQLAINRAVKSVHHSSFLSGWFRHCACGDDTAHSSSPTAQRFTRTPPPASRGPRRTAAPSQTASTCFQSAAPRGFEQLRQISTTARDRSMHPSEHAGCRIVHAAAVLEPIEAYQCVSLPAVWG